MTERDPNAERGEEPERHGAEDRGATLPPEEEAAWAAIVAGYGVEPEVDGSHGESGGTHEPAAGTAAPQEPRGDETENTARTDGAAPLSKDEHEATGEDEAPPAPPASGPPAPRGEGVHSFTVYAAGTGPRVWIAPQESDDDHFVPPEPPPLPETDTTTKFAWLGAIGGPLLLIGAAIFGVEYTWWLITLGIGGFLGGFGTLLTHLRDGDEDGDDPGGGAVV